MTEQTQVSSINFEPDGSVAIHYMRSTDVRVGGHIAQQHVLFVSAGHPDYREDCEALHRKVLRMLDNALEDYEDSEPFEPAEDNDDDEPRGMGDH